MEAADAAVITECAGTFLGRKGNIACFDLLVEIRIQMFHQLFGLLKVTDHRQGCDVLAIVIQLGSPLDKRPSRQLSGIQKR